MKIIESFGSEFHFKIKTGEKKEFKQIEKGESMHSTFVCLLSFSVTLQNGCVSFKSHKDCMCKSGTTNRLDLCPSVGLV